MATTVTKQIVRGERIGEVTFCEQRTKKYYDDNNKLYEIWGSKKGDWFFAEEVRELLDKIKPSDGYYLLKIMSHLNDFNEICSYNSHRQRLEPIRSQADFADFLGISKPSMSAFLKRMQQLQIILPAVHVVADTKKLAKTFYFTPVMLLRKKKIKLDFYATFKDVINPRLTNAARYELEGLIKSDAPRSKCQEDKKDEIAAIKDIVNDNISDAEISAAVDDLLNKMKEKKEPQPMDLFNVFGEEENDNITANANIDEAGTIAKEYICHWQSPQLYALEDNGGGMRKTAFSPEKDIYFAVNTPSQYLDSKPKNSDIVNYNAWFIDIDCGKDENGRYFTVEEVEKRKAAMRDVISALPPATYVNTTRNGYHIYYACQNVNNEEEWRKVENLLIETISIADKAVKDPARLMRCPESIWHKNGKSAASGCESFKCKALVAHRVHYTADELLNQLDACAEQVAKLCDEYAKNFNIIEEKRSNKTAQHVNVDIECSARISDIKNLSTATFEKRETVYVKDDVKDYLRHQDLAEFLQIANPGSFCCVFHDDHSPSATIYSNESGDRYVCAAASCGVSSHGWDIIDCVMNLAGCDFMTALKYLTMVYNVKEG